MTSRINKLDSKLSGGSNDHADAARHTIILYVHTAKANEREATRIREGRRRGDTPEKVCHFIMQCDRRSARIVGTNISLLSTYSLSMSVESECMAKMKHTYIVYTASERAS